MAISVESNPATPDWNATDIGELTCGNFTDDANTSSIGGSILPLSYNNLLKLQKWISGANDENVESGLEDGEGFSFQAEARIANPDANVSPSPTATHCPYNYDRVLCWPPTLLGHTASLPCMEKLHGIPYNTSGIATRMCGTDGEWGRTNYSSCEHTLTALNATSLDTTIMVYFYGYGLSLTALICAAVIFIAFKELRCLRNTIHSHLIITYILHDALWAISIVASIYSKGKHSDTTAACAAFILLHYFYLAKFYWMFVEGILGDCILFFCFLLGLYLYVLVVQTFMAESIKLRTYCIVGWGIPLLVVILWCFSRWITMDEAVLESPTPIGSPINPLRDIEQNMLSCPWLHENVYDWIHKATALLCLAANMLFLLQIMWVLITKLRSATTPETQQSRKAAKALVVLMPLLGITYILILIGPRTVPAYEYARAFLISTQGFLVALFYCFLNQEVRLALRHRWNRIRSYGPDCTCCGCETENERRINLQQARDWSPRSRTESIRLYTPTGHTFRKRESSASETTTMTAVLGSYNGSGGGQNIVLTTIPGRKYSATPFKSSNIGMIEDTAFI